MKIRHEVPKAEMAFFVTAPLVLTLPNGQSVNVQKWSLDGVTYPDALDVFPKEASLSIPFQGVNVSFPVTFEADPETRFLRFVNLSGRHRETLAVFYRSLLSGRMASTQDVITSLDTPVDLVPMGETEEETAVATAGKTSRSLRAMINVALYSIVALLVLWTLGQGIWSKTSGVSISNSRIEADLLPHLSVEGGFVDEITVSAGQFVRAGDILVRLSDPKRSSALTEVRGRITLLETRLAKAEGRAADLAGRIATARSTLVTKIAETQATPADLEAFDARYYAPHVDLFVAETAVLNEIDALVEELRRLRRQRGDYRDAADALHIMAKADGYVTEIDVLKGQFVPRGGMALTLERDSKRQAIGWVNPNMARALFPGMEIAVQTTGPMGLQKHIGRIAKLEAGINEDLTSEFGMLVFVDFPNLTPAQARATLPHLSPVTLTAKRAWASGLERRFAAIGL